MKNIYALIITLGLCYGKAYGAAAGAKSEADAAVVPNTATFFIQKMFDHERIEFEEKEHRIISAIPNQFHYDEGKKDEENKAVFAKFLEGISSGSRIAVFFPKESDHMNMLNGVPGVTLEIRLTGRPIAEYPKK